MDVSELNRRFGIEESKMHVCIMTLSLVVCLNHTSPMTSAELSRFLPKLCCAVLCCAYAQLQLVIGATLLQHGAGPGSVSYHPQCTEWTGTALTHAGPFVRRQTTPPMGGSINPTWQLTPQLQAKLCPKVGNHLFSCWRWATNCSSHANSNST